MKVETVLYNSTLALLAIVLIIYLVMSLLPSTKDKFVSDVTKINLQAGNQLLEESCFWETFRKMPVLPHILPPVLPPPPPPWLNYLPPTMAAVFSLLIVSKNDGGGQHGTADSCSKLSPEQVDALSAPISVSKLQAEQFYLNNSVVVDQIYKVKTTRECFQSFVNVLVQLEANHKTGDKMMSTLAKYGAPFLNCVKKLSLTERENVINLIISLVMSEVKSVPRKILEEYLI